MWEHLSDLKKSYPIEVAKYSIASNIAKEPAFAWWVLYILKKRDQIISAVNKQYLKKMHKFGMELPKDAEDAKRIDQENGNMFWQDATVKEMKNLKVAFKIFKDGEKVLVGYQYMDCHLVYDVKLDRFI